MGCAGGKPSWASQIRPSRVLKLLFFFSPFSDLDFKFESIFLWEVQTQVNFLYLHDNIN
jgi:hypothetical protein